jgi:hypothetical protein
VSRALLQVAESDATGEIAEIYADIRTTLRVPIVNLVWRYLAATPGALRSCWQIVRPLYADGYCERAAQLLETDYQPPELGVIDQSALDLGVTEVDQATVHRILATYVRANPLNLVALSVLLLHLLEIDAAESLNIVPIRAGVGVDGELPVIPNAADLEPAVSSTVERLDNLGRQRGDNVTPSVFRHLAYWPGFLELAHDRLAPVAATDSFTATVAQCSERAARVAASLLPFIGKAERLEEPAREQSVAILRGFTEGAMPRIITLLALLQRSMPVPLGDTESRSK